MLEKKSGKLIKPEYGLQGIKFLKPELFYRTSGRLKYIPSIMKKARTGIQSMIDGIAANYMKGDPLQLEMHEQIRALKNFRVTPGNKGEIICRFTCPSNSERLTFRFIAKKDDNGKFNPGLKFSKSKGGISSHIISGLKSGRRYTVYAYISDPEISDEIMISETVYDDSFAG
jgi:hypothetical protein